MKEFLSTPPHTPADWQPLVAFVRRPPKPPSSPNLPSSSGSGSLHRSRSKREPVPTPQTNLVTFLHSYPDVYELLLKVQEAEKLCEADLLSDRAREAVLLLDRFGGLTYDCLALTNVDHRCLALPYIDSLLTLCSALPA